MDYRDHFSHFLQHLAREIPADCENRCPWSYLDEGGIIWDHQKARAHENRIQFMDLLQALQALNFIVGVERQIGGPGYYPTPLGLDYLAKHKHRVNTWINGNWFAAIVATVTILVAIANVAVTVFLR